jgi:hypothetical protein
LDGTGLKLHQREGDRSLPFTAEVNKFTLTFDDAIGLHLHRMVLSHRSKFTCTLHHIIRKIPPLPNTSSWRGA